MISRCMKRSSTGSMRPSRQLPSRSTVTRSLTSVSISERPSEWIWPRISTRWVPGMRALTWPLVSGQMPPAVRMRCTFASRRRSARISVSLALAAVARAGPSMVISSLGGFGGHIQIELVDQAAILRVLVGEEFLERGGVQIAHAEQQRAHVLDEVGPGAQPADRPAPLCHDRGRRALRREHAVTGRNDQVHATFATRWNIWIEIDIALRRAAPG